MNEITFSVFTDLHYLPGIFYTEAESRLDIISQRAIHCGADFMIHLGDISHEPTAVPDLIARYNGYPLPTYHCIGNHECQGNTYEDVLRAFGLENGYYYFDRGGFRFIVLDTNYMRVDGKAVHYALGNYFTRPSDAQLVTLEETQKAWLIDTVMGSPYPCILFSHHSLERANNFMSEEEREDVWEMLQEFNRDKQRVILAVNGHNHMNNLRVTNRMAFLDLNSASYDWLDSGHSGLYPQDMYDAYQLIGHTLVYQDPLSAVITVREDGTVKINGVKSTFLYGIDRKAVGVPLCDTVGRFSSAEILSAEVKTRC